MTAMPGAAAPVTGTDGTRLARAGGLLAAEWLKLWTVRSSYLMLAATAGVALFVASGLGRLDVSRLPPGVPAGNLEDVVAVSFRGFAVAQLVMAVFGALAITTEYGSGLIRTTFMVTPQRGAVLAAKAAVVGTVALIAGQLLAFACFLSAQAAMSGHGGASLAAPHVLPAVVGGGCYLGVVALIGLGTGALVRHTAGAITVAVAFLYLLPNIGMALPYPWNWDFANVFPSTAAQQITSVAVSQQSHALQVGPSYALLAAYSIGIPCIAAWQVRRRDA